MVAVLTAQDFWAIADAVNVLDIKPQSRLDLTIALAERLAKTNPEFQRDLFMKACMNPRAS